MRNELGSDNGKAQSTTGNEGKRLCVIIWNYFVYSQFAIKSFLQKALTVVHMHDWMWKSEKTREREEKNRHWKWDEWTLTRHSPHIMPSETFMKRTQDEVTRKNEENSRMLLIFVHRSMTTTLKDISYCLWVSTKRNIEQGKRLKHTPFTKPYISIAFFIGHLDTPGWNVGIACLKLMHQISSSPFLRHCCCFTPSLSVINFFHRDFIFGILGALHIHKLTMSEKYCLFSVRCVWVHP